MSMEPTTPVAEPEAGAQTWPALSLHERRVLGVLVEKAKTTPDVYPLTRNALVNGCNQKNNRDPVLSLTDADVEEAIAGLKKYGMVQQITGSGRTDKYRHVLYELLKVDKVQLAILAELLLRGPQTEGELRGRASRMEAIPDLETLRPNLRMLAQRGLVVYLSPEGRRGTAVTHGFHAPDDVDRLRARAEYEPMPSLAGSPGPLPAPPPQAADLANRVAALESQLAEVRAELQALRARMDQAPLPSN